MKKLELQKFGVQELDAREVVNVQGGKSKLIKVARWLTAWMIDELIENPNAFTSPNAHTTPYGHMGGARP